MDALNKYQPYALAVLRIVAGYMFFLHGSGKLLGIPNLPELEGVNLHSIEGVAAVLEFFGGPLLILGLFTRPVAFLLSGEMAVAYFTAHATLSTFWMPLSSPDGDACVLFCFVFLYIFFAGSGAFAIDNVRKAKLKFK